METVKVMIEVPKPPDEYEVIGPDVAKEGDLYLWKSCWEYVGNECFYGCLARKKQTLASWMNAQPDFQVLARMVPHFNERAFNRKWSIYANWPKPPMDGRVVSKDGKWVDL